MSAIFSADAIKSELETTIQLAQGCLESYSVDSSDISPLSETQDYVRQLRGIFQVLEEGGAVSVCDEMNITLNSIPEDVINNEKQVNLILEALSQTLVILSRFLDLISFNNKAVPSLLLPAINSLRAGPKSSGTR